MAMSTHERAKKAAAARWAKTTPEQRKEAAQKARDGITPAADLKKARTIAARHGYTLVKIEQEDDGQ